MTELFNENQPFMPLAIVVPMALVFPIIVFLMLFVLEVEVDDFARIYLICMAVILPIINLVVLTFLIRVRTIVDHESVILKARMTIPLADIESVSLDDFKRYKEFCLQNGHGLSRMPIFGCSKGLRFELKEGGFLFIGSKKPTEFENAVRMALRRVKRNEEE